MDTKPIVLIADKGLNNQALLGDLLTSEAQISSLVSEAQLEYWFNEVELLPSLLILDLAFFQAAEESSENVCQAFCQRWLTHPVMRQVPIIISANQAEETELLALTFGAVEFIGKPFNPLLTLARIKLQLKQVNETRRLSSLSMTDGLTQIANRRYFNEFYSTEWRRACREQGSVGLIMMDIDCFKAFNDHYGHLQGDECLTLVAQQLKSVVQRPRDFVARYGGEEFVVLLPSIQADGVRVVAERLQQAVTSLQLTHEYSSAGQIVSLSMGLAWCQPDSSFRPEQLIAAADEALYSAKDAGRDGYSEVVIVESQPVFQAG
jgi:diguanylate cyclase (GGDEF)-like protein